MSEPAAFPSVTGITADLFFRAKIEETARAAGLPRPSFVPRPELAKGDVVLLELGPRTGGVEAVARIHEAAPAARIVAFGSHVDAATLARALELGASESMPRSRFARELPRILRGEGPGAGPAPAGEEGKPA